MSELDVLRRVGDQITPPPLEALRDTARRRDRRTVVAAGIATAVAVAAVAATTVVLTSDETPPPQPVEPTPNTSRPVTYAEGSTVHYGGRAIEADGEVVELDLTDDGVAFRTADDTLWFAHGSAVDRIGEIGETGPGYGDGGWPLLTRPGWVLSGNSGSRLVWFEFPAPGEPEVVVYDTRSSQEVARDPVTLGPAKRAVPALVSEDFVYWYLDPDPGAVPEDTSKVRYDPVTGAQAEVSERQVYADLNGDAAVRSVRTNGDGGLCGGPCPDLAYTDGMNTQMCVCGKEGVHPVGAGDAVWEDVTGKPFAFDAMRGYPETEGAWLVEWLDDETVVVLSPRADRTDLLACHLDTGGCEVAVSRPGPVVAPEFGKSLYFR